MPDLVGVTQNAFVQVVTLNRPEARNALNTALCLELLDVIATATDMAYRGEIRCLLLSGAGKAFCAGADLRQRAGMTPDEASAHSLLIARCADVLSIFPCPTVALLHGATLGGGLELALACDIRLCDPDVTLGFPEITFGFFPGAGGPVRLTDLVGNSYSRYLLITGKRIDATEALRSHLVHEVTAPGQLPEAGRIQSEKIVSVPPGGQIALKRLLREIHAEEFARCQSLARRLRDDLNLKSDVAAAVRDFASPRRPQPRPISDFDAREQSR